MCRSTVTTRSRKVVACFTKAKKVVFNIKLFCKFLTKVIDALFCVFILAPEVTLFLTFFSLNNFLI